MKALEKDRNRRYETASAFAADVERYLADEPVQACPPTAWYRFGKCWHRHPPSRVQSWHTTITITGRRSATTSPSNS